MIEVVIELCVAGSCVRVHKRSFVYEAGLLELTSYAMLFGIVPSSLFTLYSSVWLSDVHAR